MARSSTAGVGDAEIKGTRRSKTDNFANVNMIDASKQSKLIPLPFIILKGTFLAYSRKISLVTTRSGPHPSPTLLQHPLNNWLITHHLLKLRFQKWFGGRAIRPRFKSIRVGKSVAAREFSLRTIFFRQGSSRANGRQATALQEPEPGLNNLRR